jgi:geranylgeranyl reductase family protein
MRSVDVVVVGAGPAGTAAAITAARSGLDVLVVDKATFPRDKICGDGLTTGALRHLEHLGLQPSDVASWTTAQACWIRSPSGRTIRFSLPEGDGQYAAVATRRDLDSALVDLARKQGADVLDGHAVTAARELVDSVELDVDGIGAVRARWAVGADGMWSPLRKQLGVAAEGYRGEWHAFRQYVSNVGPVAARDLYVSFEADLVPGYFWSFPLPEGRANIGFGIQRGGAHSTRDMKYLWPALLDRPHIRAVLGPDVTADEPHRAWPIPARVDSLPPVTRRTLFVGDAVAACDVMTGEGIGQALVTGIRAAESVIAAGAGGDAAADYEHALRRELVADHRMSALLVRGLSTPAGASRAVAIAATNDWTRRNFARWLFEDYPRALIATPRRWRRGAVTRPGAFRTV